MTMVFPRPLGGEGGRRRRSGEGVFDVTRPRPAQVGQTPSPVSPRLVKAPDAIHPLPRERDNNSREGARAPAEAFPSPEGRKPVLSRAKEWLRDDGG